jgi:hypothetical protein
LPARRAIGATMQPVRRDIAARGDDHGLHRPQEADAPAGAIAAMPLPGTART